ncbi:hypothetical protein DERP_014505 [Dermatophagoides pteronyssinus]|uniref:Uncharacterized protein n=1 Tax=Dermatophagoides pteronyssinus TaxID=6956 RepID=A0ABQ8JU36_DERPT|nr:hypothetical protein DERP_014505 [Dermatophagoides pteronyssinus]
MPQMFEREEQLKPSLTQNDIMRLENSQIKQTLNQINNNRPQPSPSSLFDGKFDYPTYHLVIR